MMENLLQNFASGHLFERNPNDFCSYGERKEGADNG